MPFQSTIASVQDVLESTFTQVDEWFDQPAELLKFQPTQGNWSIAEVLEHISLTNHFLMLTLKKQAIVALRRARNGKSIAPVEPDLSRVDIIGQRGSFDWVRPEHMEPTGTASSDVVRETLRTQLDECLELLASIKHGEGTLVTITMSVNQLGKIDLYQWLYFIGQHARRHLQQMDSIRIEYLTQSEKGS